MAEIGELITTCNGRLTLTSGVPVTTSDVTAATTLYFTPYLGDHIALWNGEAWIFHQFEELSLSLSGYTADTNYDIWMYNNAGVLTLESTAWASATARATALATLNGIYVKSGDALRRFLGTIRTTSTTGQCEDSLTKRFVSNLYNRAPRALRKGATTDHTYSVATLRAWNNDTSHRVELVICLSGLIVFHAAMSFTVGSGTGGETGVGINTTTGRDSYIIPILTNSVNVDWQRKAGAGFSFMTSRYNYIQVVEISYGTQTYRDYMISCMVEM